MTRPETPAQLYDYLRETFGVGSYDAIANPEPPFYASRMTEIAKIKSMLRKRRATVEDVVIAAEYAQRMSRPIAATWQVFQLIPEAARAERERRRQQDVMERADRRNDYVTQAFNADEHVWAARLINASDRELDAVIDQWRNRP